MPTLLSRLLCALAAAALALTAGSVFSPSRSSTASSSSGTAVAVRAGAAHPMAGRLRRTQRHPALPRDGRAWEIQAIGAALHPVLGLNLATTTISHPLVLTPVFTGFSVLAPTWLTITLPAYALLAAAAVKLTRPAALRGRPVRRARSG